MNNKSDIYNGFTLVELLVSAALLVITLSLALAGFAYFLRSTAESNVQNELDIDVQTAMERIKYDIRLSALNKMFFYPEGPGPYTAISFPMARDDDGDGAIELDSNTNIIWDQTYIYHVWQGNPNELRLTIFNNRDNSLSDAQRQQQLNSVVANGNGNSALNGNNSSTTVVFANLFNWSISPAGAIYDGYSPVLIRDRAVSLGGIVLSNGTHNITFKVIGKNNNSSGYKIGVDSIYASPCEGLREAEAQLPVVAESGATAAIDDMSSIGSWSGNYQLLFPATAVGQYFTLAFENDRWEETNFRGTGSVFEDTKVYFDTSLNPKDFVISLDAAGYCWYAEQQTGDLYPTVNPGLLHGAAIRVLVRGEDMLNGGWINSDGKVVWMYFWDGGSSFGSLEIQAATIAECADQENPSMDINPATLSNLAIYGTWGYNASYYIKKEKSYIVSFLISDSLLKAHVAEYKEQIEPGMINSYIIPRTSAPNASDLSAATWSSRGDVISTNALYALYDLWTYYPTNGYYISQIIDTGQDTPHYINMTWNETVPTGASLTMKVRSGNSNNLVDATSWTNITAMTAGGSINPGNKRYFQFRADMKPTSDSYHTPLLKDVTVRWSGVERYVDVGGTFTKGPDYGIFKVMVDGKDIKTGVQINLEIFETARGIDGKAKLVTSSLSSEVNPRNTGL